MYFDNNKSTRESTINKLVMHPMEPQMNAVARNPQMNTNRWKIEPQMHADARRFFYFLHSQESSLARHRIAAAPQSLKARTIRHFHLRSSAVSFGFRSR
jgi:hypothetical protein